MTVKPWGAFTTDLPDDQVEDGQQIFVFGGQNVAVAIGHIFESLGCTVSTPDNLEELGWEFDVYDEERRHFSCRVISFHPTFHLLFEDPSYTRQTADRNAGAYAKLAQELAAALEADARFHDVTWWSMKEGPPEPDEIGPSATRPSRRTDVLSPMAKDGKPRKERPAWGCLAFAFLYLLSGAFMLVMVLAGIFPAQGEYLGGGALTLAVGLVGLLLAGVRRVDT